MSKRTHTDMTEGGAALIGTVQRLRSARMAWQMMMLVMVFSLINISTILMTEIASMEATRPLRCQERE